MMGHLGVIISNGAKWGVGCCEVQAGVYSETLVPRLSLSPGADADFLLMDPNPFLSFS